MSSALIRVSSSCHTCASLQKLPSYLISQTSDDPPDVVGISFAADVIKRQHQLILVLRECATSYTNTCLLTDEKHDSLLNALTCLIVDLHPIDGPRAVVRVDPAPGFVSLSNNDSLKHLNVWLDVGRVKNRNKNPVAEKAVQELEEEFLRQEPGGGPVSPASLAVATARLNARLRHQGLSSRELWTQRSQFTGDQLPVSDHQSILAKHQQRLINHPYSEKAKNSKLLHPRTPQIHVGDLVYLIADRDKLRARDRYIVTEVNDPWCFIKKFTGSQLRASSYKVKLCECYVVPTQVAISPELVKPEEEEDCEELPTSDEPQLPQPPSELTRPYGADVDNTLRPCWQETPPDTIVVPNQDMEELPPTTELETPPTSEAATDHLQSPTRPQRSRKQPSYLKDFILY